ncbi:MAG: Glu-tRNA(Gln) amidotransferase subunit GatE [Candidatus Woesearchaeota archaeon]
MNKTCAVKSRRIVIQVNILMDEQSYAALGLKVGLEIHQQLDTGKLFCNCPSIIVDDKEKPDLVFSRKLLAVEGEGGIIDNAAAQEQKKDKTYVYHYYQKACCLVEMDEEPPHKINPKALNVALQLSLMLEGTVIEQIPMMRKTVVDGSNTTGFQRTALIALGGKLRLEGWQKPITIQSICLEEDSAKIIERTPTIDRYNLSRLGIPLIEIATGPDITSPTQAKEVAQALGMLLRSTKKVKRGIGTIRQDLNISIKNGERVEIKGVQELRLIPTIIEYEIQRQLNLASIYEQLRKKNITFPTTLTDVTTCFSHTASSVIANILASKGIVLGICLPWHRGLLGKQLQPGRRYGTELADYAKVHGVKGLFHSDELPGYGITAEEVAAVRSQLACNEEDAFVLIAGQEAVARKALQAVLERASTLCHAKEVRNANIDGTSSYLRPLSSSARMYPETDIEPIVPVLTGIELPERIDEKIARYQQQYGLNEELATLMAKSSFDLDELTSIFSNLSPQYLATVLLLYPKDLKRREQIEIDPEMIIEHLLPFVESGVVVPDAIREMMIAYAKEGKVDPSRYAALSKEQLTTIVEEIVKKNQQAPLNALIGMVMQQVRGRAEGKEIAKTVQEVLDKIKP